MTKIYIPIEHSLKKWETSKLEISEAEKNKSDKLLSFIDIIYTFDAQNLNGTLIREQYLQST